MRAHSTVPPGTRPSGSWRRQMSMSSMSSSRLRASANSSRSRVSSLSIGNSSFFRWLRHHCALHKPGTERVAVLGAMGFELLIPIGAVRPILRLEEMVAPAQHPGFLHRDTLAAIEFVPVGGVIGVSDSKRHPASALTVAIGPIHDQRPDRRHSPLPAQTLLLLLRSVSRRRPSL